MEVAARLRAARAGLTTAGGRAWAGAWSDALDEALRHLLADLASSGGHPDHALVALGSYGRRELCPGSDVDVLLLVPRAGPGVRRLAERLWYPLWDAGLVLGHAVRTPREARRAADADPQILTALLDGRVVGGTRTDDAEALLGAARRLAVARRGRLLERFCEDRARRSRTPGAIAERREPDLKDGLGGLRDLHVLRWLAHTLGPGGDLRALAAQGYLRPQDPHELASAGSRLLEVRIALHLVGGSSSDLLTLERQDEVAARLGEADATALVRDVATRARRVAWITDDCLDRLRATQRGPSGRRPGRDRDLAPGVVVRDGRVRLARGAEAAPGELIRAARLAATDGLPLDRHQLAELPPPRPRWDPGLREEFVALLAAGPGLVEVVEVLDHLDLFAAFLPEWAAVRALPQRNPFHTWNVDRHLLQTVVEAAALLAGGGGREAVVARACRRPDLLLLGALLHDIGKGGTGDHSQAGAAIAARVADRMSFDGADAATLAWLVRDHLRLTEVATRRDLDDPATIAEVAARVGGLERLELLYLLSVADARATGPAAWSAAKGALLAECYARTADHLTGTAVAGPREPAEIELSEGAAVDWEVLDPGHLRCRVVAVDRPGLLAAVAGVLAAAGLDVVTAGARTTAAGMAVETFTGLDPAGRLGDPAERAAVTRRIIDAASGRDGPARPPGSRRPATWQRRGDDRVLVEVLPGVSPVSSVVEVHAPNEPGLLARLAGAVADAGADVTLAKAATFGDRVVDTFYLRAPGGGALDDGSLARVVERLRIAAEPASTDA